LPQLPLNAYQRAAAFLREPRAGHRFWSTLPRAGIVLLAAICAPSLAMSTPVERHVAVMGTMLAIEIRATTREDALRASEAALSEIESAEALLSTWRADTPLARLNVAIPGVPVRVPLHLATALGDVLALADRVDHAFEPGVLPLVRAWGLRSGGRVPAPAELEAARRAASPGGFAVNVRASTVTRLRPDAAIDEGAWGKGWALDRAGAALRTAGASGFLDLGGQILAVGKQSRVIDVAHPRNRARTVLRLCLRDASASTSGNGERGLDTPAGRIGHLLDPKSGRPAPDFGSVTVIAPSAFLADVLSTALFVLGPEEGQALSERLRREGLAHETIFLIDRGGSLQIVPSPGAKSLITEGDDRCSK
jgi:FAD:protein FMN transferase